MRRVFLALTLPAFALGCPVAEPEVTRASELAKAPVQTAADLPPPPPRAETKEDTTSPSEGASTPLPPNETRPAEPTVDLEITVDPSEPSAYDTLEAEVTAPKTVRVRPDLTDVPVADGAYRGEINDELTTYGDEAPERVTRGQRNDGLVTRGEEAPSRVGRGNFDRDLVTRGEAMPDLATNPGPASADPTPYLPPSSGVVGLGEGDDAEPTPE